MEESFGFKVRDEDNVYLNVRSNNGQDKDDSLNHARQMKRPILIYIDGEIFDKYQFRNFALTIKQAKLLSKELTRMVNYLESSD